jgi:hypothetical protein
MYNIKISSCFDKIRKLYSFLKLKSFNWINEIIIITTNRKIKIKVKFNLYKLFLNLTIGLYLINNLRITFYKF